MRHVRHLSTPAKVIVSFVVLAATAATVAGCVVAVRPRRSAPSAKLAVPTITGGPASAVASTSATLVFTDATSPVTFECALDGGAYATCVSPKTYNALSDGLHAFKVRAKASGRSTSDAATRTWVVDARPPAVTVAFPGAGAYNAAAWTGACAAGGVCGTASDATGVASVRIALLQVSTGRYWDGSAFVPSANPLFIPATGTTQWHLAIARPADGAYIVSIVAADVLGNRTPASSAVTRRFTVDTAAPPAPTFTKTPDNPATTKKARFAWSDAESNVSFRCSLDGASAAPCPAAGLVLDKLTLGDHCLSLVVVDVAGNTSAATGFCWTIIRSAPFAITGDVYDTLAPGVTSPLNLSFTNPNGFPILVTGVKASVDAATTVNGVPNPLCDGTENLVVTRQLALSITVPANATTSLEQLGLPQSTWPAVTMPNLPKDQDACQSTTYHLSYTGKAVKA